MTCPYCRRQGVTVYCRTGTPGGLCAQCCAWMYEDEGPRRREVLAARRRVSEEMDRR